MLVIFKATSKRGASHDIGLMRVEYCKPNKARTNEDSQEAATTILLSLDLDGTRFTSLPYWGEALLHLAGFMVNGNPAKTATSTFVAMGYESDEQLVPVEAGRQYLAYKRISSWERPQGERDFRIILDSLIAATRSDSSAFIGDTFILKLGVESIMAVEVASAFRVGLDPSCLNHAEGTTYTPKGRRQKDHLNIPTNQNNLLHGRGQTRIPEVPHSHAIGAHHGLRWESTQVPWTTWHDITGKDAAVMVKVTSASPSSFDASYLHDKLRAKTQKDPPVSHMRRDPSV